MITHVKIKVPGSYLPGIITTIGATINSLNVKSKSKLENLVMQSLCEINLQVSKTMVDRGFKFKANDSKSILRLTASNGLAFFYAFNGNSNDVGIITMCQQLEKQLFIQGPFKH